MVLLVVTGAVLGGIGVYDKIVNYAGAGATVPIIGFGNVLAHGVIKGIEENGLLGIITGGVEAAAGGIGAAVFFGFLIAVIFKPKTKS